MRIKSFFKQHSFKSIKLSLSSKGEYSFRDSEWNYSDIPHLEHIHSKVDSFSVQISEEFIGNIFIQQIGPIKIPAMVFIQHRDLHSHEYLMSILNIIIYVKTSHIDKGFNKSSTNTVYQFFFNGFTGRVVAYLARYATKKNYAILMSEDMPMRVQRGELRAKGIKFIKDNSLDKIGFQSTLDLSNKNVDGKDCKEFKKPFIYSFKMQGCLDTVYDESHQLFAKISHNEISLYPAICQHEGAPLLDKKCKSIAEKCPWHGLNIIPLAKIRVCSFFETKFECYHKIFIARVASRNDEYILTICAEN